MPAPGAIFQAFHLSLQHVSTVQTYNHESIYSSRYLSTTTISVCQGKGISVIALKDSDI